MIAWTLIRLLPLRILVLLVFVLLFALFLRIGLPLAPALLSGLVQRPIIALRSSLGALVAPRAGLPVSAPLAPSTAPGVLLTGLLVLRILVFLRSRL